MDTIPMNSLDSIGKNTIPMNSLDRTGADKILMYSGGRTMYLQISKHSHYTRTFT